jgi:hypothetical protein
MNRPGESSEEDYPVESPVPRTWETLRQPMQQPIQKQPLEDYSNVSPPSPSFTPQQQQQPQGESVAKIPVTTTTLPTPSTPSTSPTSFWNSHKRILLGSGLALLLLGLLFWWWKSRKGNGNGVVPDWKSETRVIFPLNSTVTIQSQESGKYLRFVEATNALPDQPLPAQAGLALEASGEGAQDNACRWIVKEIGPTQPSTYQGSSVRLENVQYETYMRAVPLANQPNIIAYQAGTGARHGSPMWAVKADSSNAVIVCGSAVFDNLNPRPERLTADNPVSLQSDSSGAIIPLPHSPTGNSSRWIVTVVLQ